MRCLECYFCGHPIKFRGSHCILSVWKLVIFVLRKRFRVYACVCSRSFIICPPFFFFMRYGSRFAYLTLAMSVPSNWSFCFAKVLKRCCRAQKNYPGKLVASVEGTEYLCGGILAKGIWIKRHADSHFALLLEFYREKPLVVTGRVTRAVHYYRVNFVIQLEAAT